MAFIRLGFFLRILRLLFYSHNHLYTPEKPMKSLFTQSKHLHCGSLKLSNVSWTLNGWPKIYYSSSFMLLEGTWSHWSRLHLQFLVPTNPYWTCVKGYGPFSLVTKKLLYRAPPCFRIGDQKFTIRARPCFGRHVKPLIAAVFAVVSTHKSTLGARDELWPVLRKARWAVNAGCICRR
jgi:hypothetical protein